MGVDISHWLDIQIQFKTIIELRFLLERNLDRKICILYSTEEREPSRKEAEIFIGYPHRKDLEFSNFDCRLCIYDENKKIKQIETEDIQPLLKNQDVEIRLIGDEEDDIEIQIFDRTVHIYNWSSLAFWNRWYSFFENLTNPEIGFTEYHWRKLYHINNFAKAFNSQNLLLIGDSASETWSDIEEPFYEGTSIMDSIKNCEKANVITSKMILSGDMKIDDSEAGGNNILLLNFQDLLPYLIDYPIRETQIDDFGDDPKERLEVSIETGENKGKLRPTKKVVEIEIIKYPKLDYYHWNYKTFDYYGTLILKKKAYELQDKVPYFMERARVFNYNAFPFYINCENRSGERYSLTYRNVDSEISFSLWCPDDKDAEPKEFKEFIDELFEITKKAGIK